MIFLLRGGHVQSILQESFVPLASVGWFGHNMLVDFCCTEKGSNFLQKILAQRCTRIVQELKLSGVAIPSKRINKPVESMLHHYYHPYSIPPKRKTLTRGHKTSAAKRLRINFTAF